MTSSLLKQNVEVSMTEKSIQVPFLRESFLNFSEFMKVLHSPCKEFDDLVLRIYLLSSLPMSSMNE